MVDVIIDMLEFVNRSHVRPSLASCDRAVGSSKLRVAIIKFLGWLSARSKTKLKRPLKLDVNCEWATVLTLAICEVEGLGTLFVVKDDELDFSDSVTDAEREEVLTLVREAYNPRLMS